MLQIFRDHQLIALPSPISASRSSSVASFSDPARAEYFPAGFHSAYGYHQSMVEQTTAQAYRIITLEVFSN